MFLRAQRVLLAPGEVTVELGLFYSRSDNEGLALVDGSVALATTERDTFTTQLTVRYGLIEETQVFAGASVRHQETGTFFGSRELSQSSLTEFGDVRLGVRRTVLREGPGLPDVIATIDGSIPTGDTSSAVGGGIALIKSLDPV